MQRESKFGVLSPLEIQNIVKDAIKQTLNKVENSSSQQPKEKDLLNAKEACEFLNLAKPTLYSLTSKGDIPYYKKAKKLYFKRSELLKWIETGRHKTNAELEQEATKFVRQNSRK